MQGNQRRAFLVSTGLHGLVVGLILLLGYTMGDKAKEVPRIFELVGGQGGNDTIYGTLANDPMDLGTLKLGSRVKTTAAELNDWLFFDAADDMQGGFTIKVVETISKEKASEGRSGPEAAG